MTLPRILAAVALASGVTLRASAQEDHAHHHAGGESLGTVHFSVS